MKPNTKLVLCVRCLKYKDHSEFSHFYSAERVKVRECDYCHNHPKNIEAQKAELRAKKELRHAKLTPMQKALSSTAYAEKVRARKARLEAIQANLEFKHIKEEIL